MRLKLLETILHIVSKFFVNQLRSNFRYLKKLASEEKFIFDVTRLSNKIPSNNRFVEIDAY